LGEWRELNPRRPSQTTGHRFHFADPQSAKDQYVYKIRNWLYFFQGSTSGSIIDTSLFDAIDFNVCPPCESLLNQMKLFIKMVHHSNHIDWTWKRLFQL
jgi:hypothetical protein